jgi:alpha-D-ribose 1-methylphosphonate 5-triphosphate diphosphatase
MVERTGLSNVEFDELVERTIAQRDRVPDSIARLAAFARSQGTPMLSHDDETPEQRKDYRAQGVTIAEFPVNEPTAMEACRAGEFVVFGAPNVVRGGSHTGWTSATDMIRKGLCSVLASDYYYPAPLLAAFRLVADEVLSLPQAWRLVSGNPARAAGLRDRGEIKQGARADVILVDASELRRPRVVAAIAGGKLVYLSEATRLFHVARVSPRVAAA